MFIIIVCKKHIRSFKTEIRFIFEYRMTNTRKSMYLIHGLVDNFLSFIINMEIRCDILKLSRQGKIKDNQMCT